jgi:DNA-binding MarR family transcriptional regulator/ribosomal protein S18 acetylase RimI-like enzyme
MTTQAIRQIRAFNRWYTDVIGLLNRHLLDSDHSLAEARLIYEIHKAGSIRATGIMGIMHIDKSYLSRLLKKLEKEKLVTRRPAPEDARAALLSLTEKGRKTFDALNRASDKQIGRLLEPLGETKSEALVDHMRSITRLLSAPETANDKNPRPGSGPTIRTTLQPGDLGYIAYLHGRIYDEENGYGLGFESYVLEGLGEFGRNYDPRKDRLWVCEDGAKKIGFLIGIHRGKALQLRYFILEPEYRGMGLGKRLMELFIGFMHEAGYRKAYLWTTHEQAAAISLYTRHGFLLAEEKQSKAFNKPLIERKYELDL